MSKNIEIIDKERIKIVNVILGQSSRYGVGSNKKINLDLKISSLIDHKWVYNRYTYIERKDNMKLRLENTDKVEIKPTDSVFFTKSCTYPRYKLRNFTENKRTIKVDKADIIVIPENAYSGSRRNEKVYVGETTGNIYTMGGYNLDLDRFQAPTYYPMTNIKQYIQDTYYIKDTAPAKDYTEIFLTMLEKVVGEKLDREPLHITTLSSYSRGSHKHLDEFIDIINREDLSNIIYERDIEKYVSKFTMKLDEEQFKVIDTYLKSKDADIVALGLRTLTNFSTDTELVPLALLIIFNAQNIRINKEWNSTSMKAIRNVIPNSYILANTSPHYNSTITSLNIITKNCVKTDLDREMIRSFGIPLIKKKVETEFSRFLESIDFIDKFEIVIE